MPDPLSANTFSRAFLSPDHMIGRAKNYTDTVWKEIKRCITAMFTCGGSEIWHAYHAEEVEEAFVTAAKEILDAEITGDEDGEIVEINTVVGPLKIIQKSTSDSLEATLNGVRIDTHDFTSIEELREAIRTNLHNNPHSAEQYLSSKEKEALITRLQAHFRRHNVTGVKESQADVPALRLSPTEEHPIGEVIAYGTANILQRQKHFPFVAYPKPEAPRKYEGGDKTLTHLTPRQYQVQPGDTLSQIAVKMGQSPDNLLSWNELTSERDITVGQVLKVAPSDEDRLVGLTLRNPSAKIGSSVFLEIIHKHHLTQIKPQLRIDASHVMADYLGPADLHQHIFHPKYPYKFDPLHFQLLAKHIDILHSCHFLLLDIKPSNMFFVDGHVCVTDLDYGGRVGTFKWWGGTLEYVTPQFLTYGDDNANQSYSFSGYARDRYSFLISMMVAYHRAMPFKQTSDGKFIIFSREQILAFSQQMPCSEVKKIELRKFLSDPGRYPLRYCLSAYFKSAKIPLGS